MVTRVLPLVLLLAPVAALAQAPAMADADALAEQVRRLGANPQDLDALLTAGELSVRMEDLSAAGAFLARAEKIDPRNGRAKAGEAAMLVHSERPAEALRYFAQAEGLGWPAARFAGERGLAYDLLGDPGRAERDYRVALSAGTDPEARRRYALSLAIAGRQQQALAQLDPLIRANDRGAWRSRAFVLAMGGDVAGATRIAETMMPPGAATALQAFFTELPRLSAVDKAFAVHFGEVQATPQRLADARLPHEAPLPLAAVAASPSGVALVPTDAPRKRDRRRRRGQEVALITVPPPPPPLPEVPRYQAPAYVMPAAATPVRDRPLSSGELAALNAGGNRLTPNGPQFGRARSPYASSTPVVARALTSAEARSLAAAAGSRDGTTSHRPDPVRKSSPVVAVVPRPTPTPAAIVAPARVLPAAPVSVAVATPTPALSLVDRSIAPAAPPAASVRTPVTASPSPPAASPAPRPGFSAASGVEVASVGTVPRPPVAPPRPRRSYAQADSVLSRIVARLSIPAAELAGPAPPTAAERRATDRQLAAAAAKIKADREAAEERRAARAEPARIWVQVGGGANEAALSLSWRTIKAKAPQAFASHAQGWTTPLRATNRILAGPFRSDADARSFVNQLARAGLSAFAFTSEAGQKIARLPGS